VTPPILSIVGRSNSGKTTLLEGLIAELRRRKYRVAVIKHAGEDIELDTVNKDTWRFTQAGSALSAINSLNHLAIYRRMERYFDPQEISNFILWDYDLILTDLRMRYVRSSEKPTAAQPGEARPAKG
jgi:molybdopterin-guanine dinucleotide biosynthesis protein B